MTLQPKEDTEDRLRAPDWQDKYRWPDPEIGWSGPLAGYPPDHPIRRGSKIALKLIARKYWADPLVTRYRAWITGWPETVTPVTEPPPTVTEAPPTVTEAAEDRNAVEPGVTVKKGMTNAERQRAYRGRKKDKPDLMVDAFAAALGKFEERAATEAPGDDLSYEERVKRDRARKKVTRELWAKTKGKP